MLQKTSDSTPSVTDETPRTLKGKSPQKPYSPSDYYGGPSFDDLLAGDPHPYVPPSRPQH